MVVPFAIERPAAQGDQLVSYYDARDGFTTFLTVRNASPSSAALDVQVAFYGGGFSVPFVTGFSLAPGALRILDVGALRASGLPAQPGIAITTAVDATGASIVTRALTGSFTVANLATGSGWGAAAAARPAEAVASAVPPPLGTVVDGTDFVFAPIQPRELDLATYYDPSDLAPPDEGGNQIIFVSFADRAGAEYRPIPAATAWQLVARRSDGSLLADTTFAASGVVVSDLASVVGPTVNGSGGSIRFSADATIAPVTRLIFFTEALGTIGTGYLLPPPGLSSGGMMVTSSG